MNVAPLFILLGLIVVLGGIGLVADVRRNRRIAAQEESEIAQKAEEPVAPKRGRGRPRKVPTT